MGAAPPQCERPSHDPEFSRRLFVEWKSARIESDTTEGVLFVCIFAAITLTRCSTMTRTTTRTASCPAMICKSSLRFFFLCPHDRAIAAMVTVFLDGRDRCGFSNALWKHLFLSRKRVPVEAAGRRLLSQRPLSLNRSRRSQSEWPRLRRAPGFPDSRAHTVAGPAVTTRAGGPSSRQAVKRPRGRRETRPRSRSLT